jgi:hypothetical protein
MPDRILEVSLTMRRGLLATALLMAFGIAAVAHGESIKQGNIIVGFSGGITPRALPRSGSAPVGISFSSNFMSADGTDPPAQLSTISIGINGEGKIYDRGLPTCKIHRIQPTTVEAAHRICGGAIIGHGNVRLRVHLENQPPFTFSGPLLVFNARRSGGQRRLLAQIYGLRPPSAFVLTFKVLKKSGTFGTVIQTTLPLAARKWAYLTHFDMKLRRTYIYRGERRSYISAGCPAPAGFPGTIYPFARAHFGFSEGNRVTVSLTRHCTVR